MNSLDAIRLNFNPESLQLLNWILAFIMFGVALDLKVADFVRLKDNPRASVVGIAAQFLLLPALTFLLILIVRPHPSLALGMMLVAACPGGNISNFLTHLAGGNTALSVSLTAVGTVLAILSTPLNLNGWASLYGPTSGLLQEVSLDAWNMITTIVTLAGIPLALGMAVNHYLPRAASVLSKGVKPISIFIFLGFVVMAFSNNYEHFTQHISKVVVLVLLHNALALSTGFFAARWAGLGLADQRTISIETGIQNSGLGLILIFRFFDGMGGMALVAAWWGIWHIVSGLTLALLWARWKPATALAK
jgi:BASS family bile acid:Na+ symporter